MSLCRFSSIAVFLLASATSFAQQAPTTHPVTRPAATPKLTAEEQAIVNADNNAPPDVAAVKITGSPYKRDGTRNANFGKPDGGFIKRHEEFVERSKQPVGLLFIGDSITDWWSHAPELWAERFGKYQPANFGIAGDRTQHVLWRIANGELDAITPNPKVVVIMIGTNNANKSPEEIAAGTTAVVKATEAKLPNSKILLLAIFPRSPKPDAAVRAKIQSANDILAKLDEGAAGKVRFLKIWDQFLEPDGTLTKAVMGDALHPTTKGYQIWADAMQPTLDEMMK